MENLEHEIHQKRRHLRALEQKIMESGEASVANASMVDMQQVLLSSIWTMDKPHNYLCTLLPV
jgi:hypothetical protein